MHFKSLMQIPPAFCSPGDSGLRLGVPHPSAKRQVHPDRDVVGEDPRQLRGLIEPPASAPSRMQRHGYHHVRPRQVTPDKSLRQQLSENGGRSQTALILELVNQLPTEWLKRNGRPSEIERRWPPLTGRTDTRDRQRDGTSLTGGVG